METLRRATIPTETVCSELHVDVAHGLTRTDAEARLSTYGKNDLQSGKRTWWRILGSQFKSPFIFLLAGAAVIAFVLGEKLDAGMIFLFILVNASLGFWQEFRSEQTLQLLKAYAVSYTTVIRDGHEQAIENTLLVPGDIVLLKTGDRVPADLRLCSAEDLAIDESVLTGESAPARKDPAALTNVPEGPHDAASLAFAGSGVVSGKGTGVVLATGMKSSIGLIAKLTADTHHKSQFEQGIARFSSVILKIVVVTLAIVFVANLLIKGDQADTGQLLLFSIALAVSVIPEALPVVMTFSLSRGALRLAKKKVVVRRLTAIEDLGGIEILCTDKTGTLTENHLTFRCISPDAHPETLLYANAAASSPEKRTLEPFDAALWDALPDTDRPQLTAFKRLDTLPFDPTLRVNAVLVERAGCREWILRGAPEAIMDRCADVSAEQRAAAMMWITKEGRTGRRTMAVAHRSNSLPEGLNAADLSGLSWLGMVSFEDPIKATTLEAMERARKLGLRMKIITGDGPAVAGAVASRIGVAASPDDVVTGAAFAKMNAAEQHDVAHRLHVFARFVPEQKHQLIQLLQENAEVGYLGEGINDAPALKAAGVSIVVQSASDIARETADIVLLEKDLKVIVNGIKEGRMVFMNTVKYIRATLASNFGNFYAVAIASLFIDFLPMLPLQILLLNLLSDFPMIALATDRVDEEDVTEPKRYDVRDIVFIATILGIVSTFFDFLFFAIFLRVAPESLQTNWFIGSILTELVFLFSIRSKRFFLAARKPSRAIIILSIVAAAVTILIPLTHVGRELFHFVRPEPWHLLIAVGLVVAYFASTEAVKFLFVREDKKRQEKKGGRHWNIHPARV